MARFQRSACFLGFALIALQGALAVESPDITHQSPEHAPPIPYLNIMSLFTTSQINRSDSSVESGFSGSIFHKRQREEDGNGGLLCKKAPCPDKSCCGPKGVCGYGKDFCGVGCTSNCDAVAICGNFSEGGNTKCGMNLCCSWGGWCGTSEVHCIGPNKFTPCQKNFGSCEIIRPKTCGEGSGSTKARTIGYYLASNSRDRLCNRIFPNDIKAKDYTHLFFSFASIDPKTFRIRPWDDADIPLMKEFTALDTNTWIAVGGYTFSDEGNTHTTWSDLCSTRENRAAFIQSTAEFMDKYGFTGVDLDWEYPVEPKRGGAKGDTENFTKLVREMREAYGNKYGISLTLAPDYWYLRYFDAEAMQPYVDFFGFMAYDLHGSWDSDVETLGSLVRGQADVREIYNDPAKINFGLAWYGRGYTLSDPSCNKLLCPFSGPSKPAECTRQAGVMSLLEIKKLIKENNLTPRLNTESMMKELIWDDQWIGYDDEETHEMKRKFANNLCFGGTMAWSVDFNSGTGDGDSAPISTDGRCGPNNGGFKCEGSTFGNCCSSYGYCGSSETHCGSGCVSGKCLVGQETTDGSCGASANGMFCGLWPQGSCCSSFGYCGDSEAHCGKGCQSGACLEAPSNGKGSGPVYIAPEVYDDPNPVASCFPPCTLIMPPWSLDKPTTISRPPATISFLDTWDTTVVTTSTVITLPPVTTTLIEVWNVIWISGRNEDEKSRTTVSLTSSVDFPPVTLTKTRTEQPPVTWTYSPGPWPTINSDDNNPFPPPPPPPPGKPSSVTAIRGPPKPTCKPGQKCGSRCKVNCGGGEDDDNGGGGGGGGRGRGRPCLGICGCIGPLCNTPNLNCVGPVCPHGSGGAGGDGGGGGDPNDPEEEEEECTTRTVTDRWVSCDAQRTTDCTTYSTSIVSECSATGKTTTTTGGSCPAPTYDPKLQDTHEQLPAGISHTKGTTIYSGKTITTWGWNRPPLGGTRTSNGGNGNGGQGAPTTRQNLPGAPTLTTLEPPYSGSECSSYLHTTRCNGSGGKSACVTQDLCVPTRPCYSTYSATGTPSCSGEYSICLSTTVIARCAQAGFIDAPADATAPPSLIDDASITVDPSVPTPELSLRPEEDSHRQEEPADNEPGEQEVSVPNTPQNQSSVATRDMSLISARQNGCSGSINGGCDYIRFCASGMCAKSEKVPCLQAHIKAHMGITSGIELEAWVKEDGVEKCRATRKCPLLWDKDCSGVSTFDCGDGNLMGFRYNYVEYYSKKYNQKYPMYLELSVDAKLVFCTQKILFREIPYVCWEDEYSWKDGPCKGIGL
ncbi:hypothetical protein GGP41_008376 [Bipolaris sorokiniana]|uniref:chitinase n=1 Tax=Cochliobolus sativus TaxID=45130 RepID=A0A8H5ZAN0_COCSA|nr:hypothetical protein GGP41_008376 [Bipolaris sorokiniana]